MRARVYIGMVTSIMLHATASSIILSSRRNGTGDIENMKFSKFHYVSEVPDFHGIRPTPRRPLYARFLEINFKR